MPNEKEQIKLAKERLVKAVNQVLGIDFLIYSIQRILHLT
jgi:hypothetical protein